MSTDPYREGYEYVVCTKCQSHILIGDSHHAWFEDYDVDEIVVGFTCDWEPCLADFCARVFRPSSEFPEDLIAALGPHPEPPPWPRCCQGGDQVAPLCTGCPDANKENL